MNEAIKLAIEKGSYLKNWGNDRAPTKITITNNNVSIKYEHDLWGDRIPISKVVIDPNFWQALGKALGWGEKEEDLDMAVWRYKAHEYFDELLTGGDTSKFWESLTTK